MGVNGRSIGFMLRSDTLQITPEILSLIARIDEFKGAWRALGTLAPDRLSALQRNVEMYIDAAYAQFETMHSFGRVN